MRLRVEFTTEPFDLDEVPRHARVAREVVETADDLDAVDVGPFGNTAEGGSEAVLTTVDALLRRALAAGATRISLQVNVVGRTLGDSGESGETGESGESGESGKTGEGDR